MSELFVLLMKPLIILFIAVIAALLSGMSLFGGGREQKKYIAQGMRLVCEPVRRRLVLPALGIIMAIFVAVFIGIAVMQGALEDAAEEMIICAFFAVFLMVACFIAGYAISENHFLYDEERILIKRPFRRYISIEWYEISQLEIKNQDFINLYDYEGRRRIAANAGQRGYHEFYQMAVEMTGRKSGGIYNNGSSYQQKYNVSHSGEGVLRYRMGEYYVLLALCLLIVLTVAAIVLKSGKNVEEMREWLFSDENLREKAALASVVFVSVLSFVYCAFQKVTYDRNQIVIKRFMRKRAIVPVRDIRRVEFQSDAGENRIVILHTDDRAYSIKEKQFRKGFPEFFAELQKAFGGGRSV